MTLLYWIFILSVVAATFYIIFKKLTRQSYLLMAVIAVLYIVMLAFSFLSH